MKTIESDEVSDDQLVKCFGKTKRCFRSCRLKELCIGKAKEQEEERHRKKYRETEYIDELDVESNHVSLDYPDEQESGALIDAEVCSAIDQLDVTDKCRRELFRLFRTKQESETIENAMLEMLRRLGEIYVIDTTGFEVMFFQILAGGTQALLARMRGCSKQNINKIISKGRKRLDAYRETVSESPECRLTFRELAVYHAVELCGMTYRQAAKILGVSHPIVVRCYQKMREKGVKVTKKRAGRRKATKKATPKPSPVYH